MKIMRDFEIMIGWLRLSIIYFISGIGGYLASAVFVPYMVHFFCVTKLNLILLFKKNF